MDGKDAIINKIISDAELKAEETVNSAEKYAEEVLKSAEEWAKNYTAVREDALKKDVDEIIARRKIVAELDVKKIVLNAKRETLDKIYAKAEELVAKSDKSAYLKLVIKAMEENAEDGDEVILSSDGVLTEKDITDSAVAKERKLTVKKTVGKFKGGVYLVGKTCDKDLTFHGMMQAVKERTLSETAKKVFGEQ